MSETSQIDFSGSLTGSLDSAFEETNDWRFDRQLYGSSSGSVNSQAQHLIPLQLLRDNSDGGVGTFINNLIGATQNSDNPFTFAANGAENGLVLPSSSVSQEVLDQQRTNGRYAVVHTGPHPQYTEVVRQEIGRIQDEYNTAIRNGQDPVEAAQKAGAQIKTLQANLADAQANSDLSKIGFQLVRNDSLAVLRNSDITQEQWDNMSAEERAAVRDRDYAPGLDRNLRGDGDLGKARFTLDEMRNGEFDSSGSRVTLSSFIDGQVKSIMGDGVSGKMGSAAIAITVASLRKLAADFMQKEDLTLAELAEFLLKAGIENFDTEKFLDIAQDAATEAAIGLALSTLRGPWAWLYTGYEVYDNYGALRGSLELAELAYPENTAISDFNNAVKTLEDAVSDMFSGDASENTATPDDPYLGSIDLGTPDLPDTDSNYRPPSLNTMQIPAIIDEDGNLVSRDFSTYDSAGLEAINNPVDIAALFSVVEGNLEFNPGVLEAITSPDSNLGYDVEYSISFSDSLSGGQTVTDTLTYRYPDGSVSTVERSYTVAADGGLVSSNLDSYEFKTIDAQGNTSIVSELTRTNSDFTEGQFKQLYLDTLNSTAYVSEVGGAGALTIRYEYDENGEIQSRVEFSPGQRDSGISELDFTGIVSQSDFNQSLLNIEINSPLLDIKPEQVYPELAEEVQDGQYLIFKANGDGAELLDQDGMLHGEVFYDEKSGTTTTILYPVPRDKNADPNDYTGDYIIEKTQDGELKAFQDPGGSIPAKDKLVVAAYQRRLFYGQQLGSGFGQILGLDGSEWQKQISSIFFGSLGKTIASFTISETTEATINQQRADSFQDEFGINLRNSAQGAAESYIGSLITLAAFEELGIDSSSQTGQALSTVATPYVTAVVSGLVDAAVVASTSTETVDIGAEVSSEVDGVDFTMIVATYLGERLGAEMYSVDTREGGITGSVGAAIGAKIGFNIGMGIGGPPGAFVGAVIGAAIGYVVGSALGDLFGTPPEATATLVYDFDAGAFVIDGSWSRGGGDKSAARDIARAASDMMSSAIGMTQGEVINDGTVYGGTWGFYKDRLTYRPEGRHSARSKFKNSQDLFNYGVVSSLSNIKIAGGDIFIKRAYYSALEDMLGVDSISEYIENKSAEIEDYLKEKLKGKDALSFLLGRVQIGRDYSGYRANSAVINALMVLQPDTAFFSTWQAALTLAQESRLDKRHEADFYGGWRYVFDEEYKTNADTFEGTSEAGASYASADFSYSKNQRIIGFEFANGKAGSIDDLVMSDQKEVIQFVNQQDLNQRISDSPLKTVSYLIKGNNDVRDVIQGDDSGNDIFGGSGNDELHGGNLTDWIDGGADDDDLYATGGDGNVLLGGTGDDNLYGADGSDWLIGGDDEDLLDAGKGDDILDGGAGDKDVLKGGAGNDVYIFRRGYGADVVDDSDPDFDEAAALAANEEYSNYPNGRPIYRSGPRGVGQRIVGYEELAHYSAEEGGGVDLIEFDEDISLNDLNLRYDENTDEFIITLLDDSGALTSDTLTVRNWSNIFRRVEKLRFADGEEVDLTNLQSFINGTSGNDAIIGTDGADFISAGAGDDIVDALAGDDVVAGGKGTDIISGGADHDLVVGGSGSDNLYGADGNDVVAGEAGNDVVYGGAGDDVLSGGMGNDFIVTGSGNDTVLFGRGDGSDELIDSYSSVAPVLAASIQIDVANKTVLNKTFADGFSADGSNGTVAVWDQDNARLGNGFFGQARASDTSYFDIYQVSGNQDSGEDTLEFKLGVFLDDIRVKQDGNDLIIALESAEQDGQSFDELADQVRLKGWFAGNAKPIEKFRIFGMPDGIDITTFGLWLSGDGNDAGDDVVYGSDGRDWITTGAGNDVITAYSGDDIISAGSGDDLVAVGDGNKIIMGGYDNDTLSYQSATEGRYSNLTLNKYYSASDWQQEKEWDSAEAEGQTVERTSLGDIAVGFENLTGSEQDDVLVGDANANELRGLGGNDRLVGGEGDDVYRFYRGDGVVTVAEFDSSLGVNHGSYAPEYTDIAGDDAIWFGDDITPDDLNISKQGFDLHIALVGTSDLLIIKDWFLDDSTRIERLVFPSNGELDIRYLDFDPAVSDTADWLIGDDNSNSIRAGGGNDIIIGRDGDDVLNGDAGDDMIIGGAGADTIDGGEGEDGVAYYDSDEAVHVRIETRHPDTGSGNLAGNEITTNTGGTAEGDVLINVENIVGSIFNDTILGNEYNNNINGHTGDDTIDGGDGADLLHGGEGNDTIYGMRGMDRISGDQGNDVLYGGSGEDEISGGSGDDTISGGAHNDKLQGDSGDDTIDGGSGADELLGNSGDDTLSGGSGDDTLYGGDENDALFGGSGNDALYGEADNDSLSGDDGDDYLDGGDGIDTLSGGAGNDVIKGGLGVDKLRGDSGEDTLLGGDGDDELLGGSGNDYLIGEAGNDTLNGGQGSDIYIFAGDFGQDTVTESIDRDADDELVFSGYSLQDLWFQTVGSDLVISVIGTENTVTVKNYARFNINSDAAQVALERLQQVIGNLSPIDGIQLDTRRLTTADINQLVAEMAGLPMPESVADVPAAVTELIEQLAEETSLEEVIEYAPSMSGRVFHLDEDGSITDQFIATDRNPGDVLTFSVVEASEYGTLELDSATGEFTFTPVENFSGNAVFTIGVSDSPDATEPDTIAVMRFRVSPVDDVPDTLSSSIVVVTAEDTSSIGRIEFSDSDNIFTDYEISAESSLGTFAFNANGSFIFTPFADAYGEEDITITLTDREGRTFDVAAAITVTGINERPVTEAELPFTALEDSTVSGQVQVFDADILDTHTFEILEAGLGQITWGENGHFNYQLAGNFAGQDQFTVRVYDSSGDAASYSDTVVVIDVTEVNDTPTALTELTLETAEDTPISGDLQADDVDFPYGDQLTFSAAPNSGQIVFNTDGTFQYYPDGDYNGTDNFVVTITDARGASTTTNLSITVTAVNDAPVTVEALALSVKEDAVLSGSLGLYDADTQYGDTHTFEASPGLGDIVFNADGTFRYTPRANVNGTDTFTVVVTDSEGATSSTQITINIDAVNDAPVTLNSLELSTLEDTRIFGDINFSDVDLQNEGDTHTFTADPKLGSVIFNNDGTFEYIPFDNLNGRDEFNIVVTDAAGAQSITQVVIDIAAVNDAPETAALVEVTTLEDYQVSGSLSLVDPDIANEGDVYEFFASPALGNIEFNQDGTFVYTPDANANGVDRFSVTVRDSAGSESVSEVVIDITPVNDVPDVVDVFASISEDNVLTLNLPVSDVDGDVLSFDSVSSAAHGSVTISADGVLTYQPDANFYGSDRIVLDVNDGNGGISRMAVNLYVNPVNDDPFAYDLVLEADSGELVSGAIWASDFDLEDILTYQIDATDSVENGSLTLNGSTGVFNYQSADTFSGTDSFTVVVDDNAGGTTSLRVAVIVSDASALEPGNDAPQFDNLVRYVTTDEDQPLEVDLRATDINGDTLTYELDNSLSSGRGQLIETAVAGVFTFIPNENVFGADAFRITVSDGLGGKDTLLLQVAVNSVNDAPVADDISIIVDEDTSITGLLDHVVDVDGDILTYSIADHASNGSVSINKDSGRFTYQGNTNFNGVDSFKVLVDDGNGGTAIATVSVTVNAVNDAPDVASVINLSGQEDTTVSGDLNASDVDGDSLGYQLDADYQPSHGTVQINTDGTFSYTPELNYNGSDSFVILVDDGQGEANSISRSTIHITAQAINDAPYDISWLGVFNVNENTTSGIVGTAVAKDVDLQDVGSTETHTYSLTNDADGRFVIDSETGVISVSNTASLDYETDNSHTITVKVTDKGGLSYEEDRSIQINNVNEAPTGITWSDTLSIAENTTAGVLISTAIAVDPEGGTHTFALLDDADGRFSIDSSTGALSTKTAEFDYEAADSYTITVQVTDDNANTYQQDVTISIVDVNEAPTGLTISGALSVNENAGVNQLVGTASASDPEGLSVTYSLGGADKDSFTIDSDGNIYTAESFDYEGKQSYSLTVVATDAAGLKTSSDLTVAVTDVNEAPANLTITGTKSVRENAGANQLVATASATDPENNAISYSISGTDSSPFKIDSSGNIYTRESLNYEAKSSYTFTVVATDNSGEATSQSITINVTNINEAPGTIQVVQALGADDRTDVNDVIGSFTATDPDGDAVTYTLIPNAGQTSVDSRFRISGNQLILNEALDATANGADPFITVRASDGKGGTIDGSFQVALSYDSPPEGVYWDLNNDGVPDSGNPTVNEDAAEGTVVGRVGVDDPDTEAAFRQYKFSLPDDADNRFTIDSNGVIRVGVQELGNASSHTIKVQVEDSNNPDASGETTLTIVVNPVNSAPVIVGSANKYVAIDEYSKWKAEDGSSNGDDLVNVSHYFTDADGDSLTYSISSGNSDGAFKINSNTGLIEVNNAVLLDHEVGRLRQLTVISADGSLNSAAITLNITVNDVNEYQVVYDASNARVERIKLYDHWTWQIKGEVIESGYNKKGTFDGTQYAYFENGNTWVTKIQLVNNLRNVSSDPWFPQYEYDPLAGFYIKHYNWSDPSSYSSRQFIVGFENAGYDARTDGKIYKDWNYFYVPTLSPVSFDLGGDGFNWETNIRFDQDNDGELEITPWISEDDALLALDRNSDGKITNGSEISFVDDLPGATTDLEGLVAFDTNNNGLLDSGDERFDEFLVWQDANSNGVSEAGELQTLTGAGIESITLQPLIENTESTGVDGVELVNTSVYTRTDGSQGQVGDVRFSFEDIDPETPLHSELTAGTEQDDQIVGLLSADRIETYGGNDKVFSSEGNDFINSGNGNDLVFAGAGNDSVIAEAGDDEIYGDTGVDKLDGGEGDDRLYGGDDSDTLIGGAGNDTLHGDAGDDTLTGDSGDDILRGGEGHDALYGGEGADELIGGEGDDLFVAGLGNDIIDGGAGNNLLVFQAGDGYDTITSSDDGQYALQLVSFTPADLVFEQEASGIRLRFSDDDSLLFVLDQGWPLTTILFADGSVWDEQLITNEIDRQLLRGIDGGIGNDQVTGTSSYDVIDAYAGDDVVNAGAGNDEVYGGAGKDQLFGEEGNDVLDGGTGDDTLDGGDGDDRLYGQAGADTLLGGDGDDVLQGGADNDQLHGGAGIDVLQGGSGDDTLSGGAGDDELQGGTGNDQLMGNEGVDQLFGGDGDDILNGGQDDDYLQGDDGNDQLFGDEGNDILTLNAGDDIAQGGLGDDLIVGGEGNDELLGNEGDDSLFGDQGDDLLDGGEGTDYMAGGADDDTYIVDSADDLIEERENEGADTVLSFVDRVLGDNLENLTLLADAVTATGNELDNLLQGNAQDNLLDGAAGADTMSGGIGDDHYVVDNVDDQTIELAGEGYDSVLASVDYQLADYLEALTLTGTALSALGNELDNTLIGNELNNTLSGGRGDDVLQGGLGNDVLDGGSGSDRIVFTRGDGQDLVKQAAGIYSITLIDITPEELAFSLGEDGILTLDLGQGDSIRFEGMDLYDSEDSLPLSEVRFESGSDVTVMDRDEISRRLESALATHLGNDRNNFIVGSCNDDRMAGLGGNDYLMGLMGDDVLLGGSGNDNLYGGLGNDRLLGGRDNDYLNAGHGDDYLDGGTGNDRLDGGHGDDSYRLDIGDGNDVIEDRSGDNLIRFGIGIEAADLVLERDGRDLLIRYGESDSVTVRDAFKDNWFSRWFDHQSWTFAFADGSEMTLDQLRDVTPLLTIGDRRNNRLSGDDLTDIMYGREGRDSLYGEGGNDELYGESGDDKLYGGYGDDLLSGGDGRDKLYGDKGNDVLIGGTGDDVLVGGDGDDTYVFEAGSGRDVIYNEDRYGYDTIQIDDSIQLDDLVFERHRRDLVISSAGGDQMTVSGWFHHEGNRVDSISVGGFELDQDAIAQLVQAHASMAGSGVDAVNCGGRTNEEMIRNWMNVG